MHPDNPNFSFPQSPALAPAKAYSQVVCALPGTMVFISGQVSVDAAGKTVAPGDFRLQTEQAMLNLQAALSAAGATFAHVVKVNWYIKNYSPALLPIVREIRARYFHPTHPPAGTLVGVTELADPEYLIEVEAIAVLH
jgi:enamine deaminase RidA (YjgF/YER057c/UK114 family)